MKPLSSKYNSRAIGLVLILMAAITSGCNSSSSSKADDAASPGIDKLTIISTSPSKSATAVSVNSSVVATFSEKMDAATINAATFTLAGADESALTGEVSLDANSNTVMFKPSSSLTNSVVYTATITTAVKSVAGKVLANNYVWTFTSGTTADTTAPTVTTTNPVNNATGVALNKTISVVFDEPLNPASVKSSSFKVTDGASAVAGTVIYAGKQVSFKPTNNLAANTLYTATLTTGIKDLAGNALAATSWEFTTGTTVAVGPKPVNLLSAGNFVILTESGITNVPTSTVTGNIGASPITAAALDDVTCTEITGLIYGSNAAYTGSGDVACFKGEPADSTLVANAVLDMGTAYNDAAGRTTPDHTELHAGDISGQTLEPGLYKWGTDVLINTDVTLAGGANDIWIFQVSGDVIQAANTSVILTGGALAKNIFWQVAGSTGVALNTEASFAGIVLAIKGITVNTGTTVNGRLFSQTAVTLKMNTITQPAQ